ncbi:MAG TPA: retropepsin-like aspartic protease [Acidobacteriaceae bacterium]|nr:retropepsin-like aspartic protease [Acidobacteriaceae bacterium]
MPALALLHLTASALLLLVWPTPDPTTILEQSRPTAETHLVDRGQAVISAPFEYFRDHIYVTLTVNGTPGMSFLLDTGTTANVLNLRTSRALGLKPESIKREKDLGLGDGKVSVAAAKNVDLEMGSVQVANILALVDLTGLERFNGHRTDGILGFPLLRRFVVEFDFEKHVLSLFPIKHYKYRGSGYIQYVSHKNKSAAIPVTLCTDDKKHHETEVELDTGSNSTLLLYPEYARGAHMERTFRRRPDPMKQNLQGYGLGGFFPIQYGELTFMAMSHTEVTPMPVFLMETSSLAARKAKIGGIVGTAVLSKYHKVIFDVPHGRIILEQRLPTETSSIKPPVPAPILKR